MRLFFDKDGTLDEYNRSDYEDSLWLRHPEVLYKEPVIKSIPKEAIILSKVSTPEEVEIKTNWVEEFFPNNLLLTTYGPKDLAVDPRGNILISDYPEELRRWKEAGGIPIKILNGVNSPDPSMYCVPQTDKVELVQQDDNSFAICFETDTECYKYYIEGEIK